MILIKKIFLYGISITKLEKQEVLKEAKEILDVEDIVASIILVDDLRIKKIKIIIYNQLHPKNMQLLMLDLKFLKLKI